MSKILRLYPTKLHENFHTSESHGNCYNEVFGHAEHESGLIFLITIISICISALRVILLSLVKHTHSHKCPIKSLGVNRARCIAYMRRGNPHHLEEQAGVSLLTTTTPSPPHHHHQMTTNTTNTGRKKKKKNK